MSRILVDLPDAQVEELAALVETEQRSRAAVIRDAIDAYIAQRRAGAWGRRFRPVEEQENRWP